MGKNLQVGDKISVRGRVPGFRHFGIFAGCGRVVHASFDDGRVLEDSFERFSGGDQARVEKRASAGHEYAVLQRARSLIGKRYDLVAFNCEHLANYAAEGRAASPTAAKVWLALGTLFVGAFATAATSGWDAKAGRYRTSDGRYAPNWF